MLFTDGSEVRGMTIDSRSTGLVELFKPLSSDGRVTALDYDAVDRHIYWSDSANGTILRSTIDGQSEVVLSDLLNPEGLAVDWISHNVYYTDDSLNVIGVVSFDGKYNVVLINKGLHQPREIAVDPVNGLEI